MDCGKQQTSLTFCPPPNFQIPSELSGRTPRKIPHAVHNGPRARKTKQTAALLGGAGVTCVALAFLPFVDTLAIYLLPLKFLVWFGGAMVLLGGFVLWWSREMSPSLSYIRHGRAAPGRVALIVKEPTATLNGQPVAFALRTVVQLEDADSKSLRELEITCDCEESSMPRFKSGDYVVVVWLPSSPKTSARIYDCLNLTDEHCLIGSGPARGAVANLLLLGAVIAIPAIALGCAYALGRYAPLEQRFQSLGMPLITGTIALGLPMLGFWIGHDVQKQRRLNEHNRRAVETGEVLCAGQQTFWTQHGAGNWVLKVVVAIALLVAGGVIAMSAAWSLNAWLDSSEPIWQPAVLTDAVQTTHKYVFRQYTLEFQLIGMPDSYSLWTSPEHISQFTTADAEADIRRGAFGWAWVNDVRPLPPIDFSR